MSGINLSGPIEGNVPPTPHYPNWRYMCPHCLVFHEMEEQREDFRVACEKCAWEILGVGAPKERDEMPRIVKLELVVDNGMFSGMSDKEILIDFLRRYGIEDLAEGTFYAIEED